LKHEVDANYNKIWKLANRFRGQMSRNDFRDVLLGLIFYRIISEEIERTNTEYFEQNSSLEISATEVEQKLRLLQEEKLGYSISRDRTYKSTLENCYRDDYYSLEILSRNLHEVSEQFGSYPCRIFDFVVSSFERLDPNKRRCNKVLCEILYMIDSTITEMIISEQGSLGGMFSTIIELISYEVGDKNAGLCSPSHLSELISRLIKSSRKEFANVYDPTFGTGLLVLKLVDQLSDAKIFGHEINHSTFNIARMNLIVNKRDYSGLTLGSSLISDCCLGIKYDVIVSHPPFNLKWDNREWKYSGDYKYVPPKSSANYAFVLQMLDQLDENGVMSVVLPHGVLFRGNVEKSIRKDILEHNLLDAVIGLPENLMYETNIPVCLLIFRKNRSDDEVLFIDASSEFTKNKKRVVLSSEDIEQIVNTYHNKDIIKGYSEIATLADIRNHNYNLSIHKYVDVFGIDMLMQNYCFSKYRLGDIADICKYKGFEDEKYLILRITNPKVINNNEEITGNNSNYISILPDEEYVYADYLKYFFSTHISKTIFESISAGVITRVSMPELKELEIPIPKKEVQKKLVESQNQIANTITELTEYRDRLVNNPDQVYDLTFKLEELRNALKVNHRVDSIKKEISCGETLFVEFKRDFSSCEEKIIKTIYAFLNTMGGKLYIGVDNDGQIIGLDDTEEFKDTDDLVLKFTNKFRDKVPEYLAHADIEVLDIDEKTVLLLNCVKSKLPVFRKKKGKSYFFVRKFASSEHINDVEEVIKYVRNHFE